MNMAPHLYRNLPERGKRWLDFIGQSLVVATILAGGAKWMAPRFLASVFSDSVASWVTDHYEPKINARFTAVGAEITGVRHDIAMVQAVVKANGSERQVQWDAFDRRLSDVQEQLRVVGEQNSRILLLLATRKGS
jgi:hypothetical protein